MPRTLRPTHRYDFYLGGNHVVSKHLASDKAAMKHQTALARFFPNQEVSVMCVETRLDTTIVVFARKES